MGFGSTSNPYQGPYGVNDHNDLMAKGVKTHDQLDVDTDIHGATLKTSPVADDEVMIEDSEASWIKKKVKKSSLGGGGVTDHGALTGLGDDDHSQYHNNTRGDARYAPLSHNQGADTITAGTLDGDRLPAMSTTKKGAVPATGTPIGNFLSDGGWAGVPGGHAQNTDTGTNSPTFSINGNAAIKEGDSRLHDGGTQDTAIAGKTTLTAVKADSDIADAITKKHAPNTDTGTSAANFSINGTNAAKVGDAPTAHGNEAHTSTFVTATEIGTHAALATGIHGVGASTVESVSGSQGKVDAHKDLTTGVHGAGASTLATTANIGTHAGVTVSVHNFDSSGNAPAQVHDNTKHTAAFALDSAAVKVGGQIGGTVSSPTVIGIRETTGPTLLTIGAVADNEYLKRSGTTLIGGTPAGGSGVSNLKAFFLSG